MKKGKCPKCGSPNLRYRQEVTEYHKFETSQFPSKDGYIDLVSLEDAIPHDECCIVCLDCISEFTPAGKRR